MKKKEMTTDEHIQLLEAQLRKPDLAPKTAAAISRRIAILKGVEKTYRGQGGVQNAVRKAQQEPPKPLPQWPLWVVRGDLIESVANRLLNAPEQILVPDEIEAGAIANLTPEKLLESAKNFLWDKTHPNEGRLLRSLFDLLDVERALREQAAKVNEPGSWVARLKAFPAITVNAGPDLSPEELRDVLQTRADIAATKEKAFRDFYEQFWERYLRPYRTVSEFDAHHPDRRSILKRSVNELPDISSDDRLVWCAE